MQQQKAQLQAEKEELEEEVKMKKHSEEELKVMVAALESVSKERQDELKEVMIDGKELKIDKLLGKGAFGVVNLAIYRGTKVAMKKLLTVNEENVLRFRHECFLMKNLAHPNVVKLVGVCWSEDLFACCLEFVENGSLEDWLRRTVGGKKYDHEARCGDVVVHSYINATPHQVEEEDAGWKESVIHRDLKPDNMLLTRDWTLKLTDFGEARAQNMGGAMTSVGTPIYIAPEVMRADSYDEKADTWSYYYHDAWRPILPINFVKAYPKLHALIQECWRVRRKERPNFDQIVARLQGEVGDEIKRKEEPKIELYSKEDDLIYRNRIGKADEIEDSDEEESGTKRGGMVTKAEYNKVVEAKDKAMKELQARGSAAGKAELEKLKADHGKAVKEKETEMEELKRKMSRVMSEVESAIKEKAAEHERVRKELEEKAAKERLWGEALREAGIGSPGELGELREAHRRVVEELEEKRGGGRGGGEGGG
ncbi:hypothetical protein TeGR_g9003 [Tetraparma gracilis]|uniref:Protein kinase domain-containing protein n=1 Tax=Tetraparma gracilis TaxID=2962635 RepID=A0ABQ6NC73_9STRA|nr:hypothetical protein TeGR_g9003 [Tetraparma gracilis]